MLKAKDCVPDIVRAGGPTVGLRCPDHPLTLAALKAAGVPFAAPSANPSGLPSPKNAGEVLGYFDGRIDAVLDGGPCGIGTESTILSMAETPYRILRQGALSEETIDSALVEQMSIIGITGGSGSGKTTALRVLRDLGALVIDADAVYHELLARDETLLAAIEKRFPGTVIHHQLDRKALAAAVFGDSEALKDLNGLTHPAVIQETIRRLRAHARNGGTAAAIDAIALIGSGLDRLCGRTYAVVADRETRIQRIDYFVTHCSAVLHNNSTEESFSAFCKIIFMEDMHHG